MEYTTDLFVSEDALFLPSFQRNSRRGVQMERYNSLRTICPGEEVREVYITISSHCGKSSVVTAFIVADARKRLKSRLFGQKQKAGNSIKITCLLWLSTTILIE